jgi:hypothetical protein
MQTNKDLSHLDIYYQEEFTKIMESNEAYQGKWNWYSFLFGAFWLLFKGAYLTAIGILVLVYLIPSDISFIVSVILWIFLGKKGTWIYYNVYLKNKTL